MWRWHWDVDGLDSPTVNGNSPNHFEPDRMVRCIGEVVRAIIGHHEDRGVGPRQPALEQRTRRHGVIEVVIARRQVVERVVQLADKVRAVEPTVVHQRIGDGRMLGRGKVEHTATIGRLTEDARNNGALSLISRIVSRGNTPVTLRG